MNFSESEHLLTSVEARAGLAGSNKMEILLFSLGTGETFGINVFKVREVTHVPEITRTPFTPFGVQGVISLRGHIIPVLNLASFVDRDGRAEVECGAMMVTEFCRRTQGFLVKSVDRIVRVNWEEVKEPERNLADEQSLITALTRLPDGTLVTILDVERVLSDAFGDAIVPEMAPAAMADDCYVVFADDSGVARRQIVQVLEKLKVPYHQTTNGVEAWDRLQGMANRAEREGVPLRQSLKLVLTDAEMPEMDGYVLTKRIKADARFEGIPVVMHSSLSSVASRTLGSQVGVDAYVAKFDPGVLAETLRPLLSGGGQRS